MQAVFLLTISLSVLISAIAQEPHHCKSPPYLEGKIAVFYPEGKTRVFEQFYYDGLEERIRVIAGKEGTIIFDRLLLYREKIYYDISYQNQSCIKHPFSDPFSPVGIPIDAKHTAQFVIGSLSAPAQGLLVNNWVGSIKEKKTNYSITFTEFGCIPVTSFSTVEGAGHFLLSFFDMVIGIENPELFVPPSFCKSAKMVGQDGSAADFFSALL